MATLRFFVDADGSSAARAIDRLRMRAEELDRQLRHPAKLRIDDKAAQAALLRTRLAADRLRDRLHFGLDLRGAARAEAELLLLEHRAEKLGRRLSGRGGPLSRLAGGAGSVAGRLGSGVLGAAGSLGGGGGDIGSLVRGALVLQGAVVAAALVPALAPAVAGAGAALGGVLAGAMLDRRFRARLSGLGATLRSVLGRAVRPITSAFARMIPSIGRWARSMQGPLRGAFAAAAPYLRTFTRFLEKSAQVLLPAFTGMLRRFRPLLYAFAAGLEAVVSGIAGFMRALSPRDMAASAALFLVLATDAGRLIAIMGKIAGPAARAFFALPAAVLGVARHLLSAVGIMTTGILGFYGAVANGAAAAFGWIPGIGPKLRRAAQSFDSFRSRVDYAFRRAGRSLAAWQQRVQNLPKVIKLQGDIADLSAKLAAARRKLADPGLTRSRRVRILGNIADLTAKIAKAKIELSRLRGKTVYISAYQRTYYSSGTIGAIGGHTKARGGLVRGPGGPVSDRAGLYALSNGEFVLRAAAVRKYGLALVSAMNAGTASVPAMAAGGPVRLAARPARAAAPAVAAGPARGARCGAAPLIHIENFIPTERADVDLLARKIVFGVGL